MTIADQLRQEGYEQAMSAVHLTIQKSRQEGALIGEILLAQRILKVQRFSQQDLEARSLEELQQIFAELETQLPCS